MTSFTENQIATAKGIDDSQGERVKYEVVLRDDDFLVTAPPGVKIEELSKVVKDLERKRPMFVDNMRSHRSASEASKLRFGDDDLLNDFPKFVLGETRADDVVRDFRAPPGDAIIYECGNAIVETCFARACRAAGRPVDSGLTTVNQLSGNDLRALAVMRDFKVALTVYAPDDKRNHVELIVADAQNALVRVKPVAGLKEQSYTFACTTMQEFFNRGSVWHNTAFYADVGDEGFGADLAGGTAAGTQGVGQSTGAFGKQDQRSAGRYGSSRQPGDERPIPPPSVTHEDASGGGSNVGGGVSRSVRRVIASKPAAIGQPVAKNYRTSNAVMFNNFGELFQDTISREYAQEIIEELFELWGVPLGQPEAVKYAEDMLWAFLISVTASNKADYNREFDIPVAPIQRNGVTVSSVSANFALFSRLLAEGKGLTRRQFARGVADDQREFLKREENQHILPTLATRIGCESLMAYLAFDGSTHCTNMTTREVTFTKTLESRNLFERDDVLAQGSSDRLMQGMSGGIRSVAPR